MFEKSPVLSNPIDAQLFLDEAYDLTYGIHNHNNSASTPLDLVAMHDAEDTVKSSLLNGYIRRFRLNSVHKHFGISLTEFFELPKNIADELLDQSVQANKSSSRDAESIEDQLRSELNKMGNL